MRIAVGLVLLAAVGSSGCAVDRASEERSLLQMWAEFERAFNEGDAVKAASLYAIDSDRISAAGLKVSGRDQIEQGYQVLLARRAADPSSAPFRASIEVRLLKDDVALLDGSWTGVRSGVPVRGLFTLVLTKEHGCWRIAAGRDRGVIPP